MSPALTLIDHQHPLSRVEKVRYPLSKVSSSSLVNRENDVRESSPLVSPTVAQFQINRDLMVAEYREIRTKRKKSPALTKRNHLKIGPMRTLLMELSLNIC